jgi:ribosomal protein S18 acetylase RimI-like enzyme
VIVRRAERGDVAEIAALWRALAESHAARDPVFALRADAEPALEAAVADALGNESAALWVAADGDGALAGFAAARQDRTRSLARETSRVEITELYVREPLRRRGVGRALADAALAWARARGTRRVEVRVSARNAEGQAFWRALGFGDFVDVLDRRL